MMKTVRILFVLALFAACSDARTITGNYVLPHKLDQLQVGQTKAQVLKLLGSPSTVVNLGSEQWIYVGSELYSRPFSQPLESNRHVLRLAFTGNALTAIQTKALQDGQTLPFTAETTPVEGNSISFVDQVVGNIGRFQQ